MDMCQLKVELFTLNNTPTQSVFPAEESGNQIQSRNQTTVWEANCSLVVIGNFLLSMEYAMYHGATDQHIFLFLFFVLMTQLVLNQEQICEILFTASTNAGISSFGCQKWGMHIDWFIYKYTGTKDGQGTCLQWFAYATLNTTT